MRESSGLPLWKEELLWKEETLLKVKTLTKPSPQKLRLLRRQDGRVKSYINTQGLVDSKDAVEGANEDPPLWGTQSREKPSSQNPRPCRRRERQGVRGNPDFYMQGLVDHKEGVEGASEDPPLWRTPSSENLSPKSLRSSNRNERQGGRGNPNIYMQGLLDNEDGVEGASEDPPLSRTPSRERPFPQNPRSSSRQGRRGRRGKPDVYTQGLLDNKDGVEGASQDPPLWITESIQKPSPQNQRLFSRQETHGERGKSDVYLQAAAEQETAQKALEAEIAAKIAKQEAIRRVREAENAAIIASAKREAMRKAQEAENASKKAIKVATSSRSTAQLLMANAEFVVYKSVMSLRIAAEKNV